MGELFGKSPFPEKNRPCVTGFTIVPIMQNYICQGKGIELLVYRLPGSRPYHATKFSNVFGAALLRAGKACSNSGTGYRDDAGRNPPKLRPTKSGGASQPNPNSTLSSPSYVASSLIASRGTAHLTRSFISFWVCFRSSGTSGTASWCKKRRLSLVILPAMIFNFLRHS